MLFYTVKANHVLYQNVLWSYKFNLKLHKRVDCLLGIYCVSPTETIWIVVSLLVNQNPIIMIVYQTIRESLLSTFFPWTKPTAHGAENNLSAVYYGTVQPKFVFCVLEFCAVSYVWLWSRGKFFRFSQTKMHQMDQSHWIYRTYPVTQREHTHAAARHSWWSKGAKVFFSMWKFLLIFFCSSLILHLELIETAVIKAIKLLIENSY